MRPEFPVSGLLKVPSELPEEGQSDGTLLRGITEATERNMAGSLPSYCPNPMPLPESQSSECVTIEA
jgi:hypothetical protein